MSDGTAKQRFPLIQALRAAAAVAVAVAHILHEAQQMHPNDPLLQRILSAMPFGAGVDVFFVTSGFVIAYSSRGLFARPNAARAFTARRLSRIVPLYWAMTTLLLLQLAFSPTTIHGSIGGLAYLAKSYAFIPAARPDGLVQPPLGLGWTLNYEMFFYAVFTPFLVLPRRCAVPAIVAALGLFVLAGQFIRYPGTILPFWANPIILEFCAGMLLAFLPGKITLPTLLRAALALVAVAMFHFHIHEGADRFLAWGLPAVLLVLTASTGKPVSRLPTLELWLVRLGDASYAMYLVHPFVMRGASLLWPHIPAGILLYAVISLTAAQIAALLMHNYVERPATTWLRTRLDPVPATRRKGLLQR